ncbi:MAG: glycosyltransferase family 4 protein [Candidatus Sulfotelmatobacter sp.]
MTSRVVIITEIIAPYRIPVFNALAQREEIDLQVVFLSESDPGLRQWRVYKEEIDFHYEVLPSWRRRLGRYNLLLNRGMPAALTRFNPDVVLCGGYNYLASWQAVSWANSRRVPFLLWSESTALDNRRRRWPVEFVKVRFLRRCQGFVVPGRSSSDYLQGLGIPEEDIFKAPNAIDTLLFSRLANEARCNRSAVQARHSLPQRFFLFVGRIVKAKGVFELLDAYAQLHPEVRSQVGLVFVGDGDARIDLTKRASKISPGIVQFAGFVHRERLPEFYALAEALIFPTHSDTWGLVVNEAMSCALPVVATSVAGCVADLVEDGWDGFVTPRGDVAPMAAAMTRLASDIELRVRMGSNSLQRAQEYSPAAWADGLVQAVQSVRKKTGSILARISQ